MDRAWMSDVRRTAYDLWRDGRGWILLTVAAGWFLSIGVRVIYSALLPFFRTEFGISLTTGGILLTVLWGAYAVGQLPGGILGDRYGEGNILVCSTVISGVAISLVTLSTSIEILFLGSMVFGLSTALFGPTRFTVFTDIYTERSGTAVGITMSAGNIGNSVLPILAVSLAGLASWRLGFGITIPAFFLIGLLLYWFVPARTSGSTALIDEISLDAVKRILSGVRQRDILAFTVIQVLLAFAYQGFVGFYPTYLVEVKGLPPAIAAGVFGIYFATGIVVQPLTGFLRDSIGSKPTLFAIIGLFAGGLLILPLVSGVVMLAGLTMALSARTGSGVVVNTHVADTLPEDMKGTGLGLLRMTWILIGATAPIVIGVIGDYGLLEEGFLLLGGMPVVALFVLYFASFSSDR